MKTFRFRSLAATLLTIAAAVFVSAAPTVVVQLPNPAGARPKAAPGVPNAPLDFRKFVQQGKGAAGTLAPSGVWTWTTYNRSMQPVVNSITLSTNKAGKVTAKVIDEFGEHDVDQVTLAKGSASFDVMYHYRGRGNFAHTFTVSLDPSNARVAVDEPDFSSWGKAHGGKRHRDHAAKHATAR